MGSVNKAIVVGNLGADPDLAHTQSGKPVVNFSVATTERWRDAQEQQQERTEWHRVVAWGQLAENCAKYLAKGRQVYVEGQIQTRKWEDRDGNTRYTTEIQARQVTFLQGGRPEQAQQQAQVPAQGQGPAAGYAPAAPQQAPNPYPPAPAGTPPPGTPVYATPQQQQLPAYPPAPQQPAPQQQPAAAPQQPAPYPDPNDVPF
jgi:single-strand DNA-binding protein